jgi:monoamine oxidase
MKVYIVYREPFWVQQGYSAEIVSSGGLTDNPGCESGPVAITMDATTKNGTPVIVGFVGGNKWTQKHPEAPLFYMKNFTVFLGYRADQWCERSLEERRHAVIRQMEQCLGPKARDYVEYIEFNWMDDEVGHIGGGPGLIVPPGCMHNFHYIRLPHGKHVYFAGTETALSWSGFMSGAVEAGWRAAAEVLENLRPEKMTSDDRTMLAKNRAMLNTDRRGEMMRKNRVHRRTGLGSTGVNSWLMLLGGVGVAVGCYMQRGRIAEAAAKFASK